MYVLEISYCLMITMVKSPATREMVVNGVGLRFVSRHSCNGRSLQMHKQINFDIEVCIYVLVHRQCLSSSMVHLLHAAFLPCLGNLPTSVGTVDAHSLDHSSQVPSYTQKSLLMDLRSRACPHVPPLFDQSGYMAKWSHRSPLVSISRKRVWPQRGQMVRAGMS